MSVKRIVVSTKDMSDYQIDALMFKIREVVDGVDVQFEADNTREVDYSETTMDNEKLNEYVGRLLQHLDKYELASLAVALLEVEAKKHKKNVNITISEYIEGILKALDK